MHQNGNKAEAFAALEKLARRHPGSHAVALTHMRLLRADDPQEAALLAQRFLAAAGDVLQAQASAVRAATLAEAAICYVAVGALADAVDALTEAIGMAARLRSVAEERRAAARAADAARRAAAEAAVDAIAAAVVAVPPVQAGAVLAGDLEAADAWAPASASAAASTEVVAESAARDTSAPASATAAAAAAASTGVAAGSTATDASAPVSAAAAPRAVVADSAATDTSAPASAAAAAAAAPALEATEVAHAETDFARSHELDLWRQAAAPTALAGTALRAPKLYVACAVGAAKEESGWLANHITAAQISIAGALVIHDASMARQMAQDAVTSGKLQPQAHDAAAQACVAMRDFGEAVRHVTAGLKSMANHTGLLRTFARLLREQGKTQDAVLVATYARDVAIKGPARVSGSVREAFFGIRESVLGI